MTLAKRQLYKNEQDENVKLLGALFSCLQNFSMKFILYIAVFVQSQTPPLKHAFNIISSKKIGANLPTKTMFLRL
jgi:hypothetical protein